MNVLGLITEYNPFHYGHSYHLNFSKEKTQCDFSVAVMSSSFLQRGEPAIVDKWARAKMAIDSGVDLIIELPVFYSVQSAEIFAYGGVKLLDSLNIVDYISFGSELGDMKYLKMISHILSEEPEPFKKYLKKYLKDGYSYAQSRTKSLEDYMDADKYHSDFPLEDIIRSPNNILAIEYLKALHRIKSNIKPFTIKRVGNDYREEELSGKFSSSGALRRQILKNNLVKIKNLVPPSAYEELLKYDENKYSFNSLENYSEIILYLLRTASKDKLNNLMDMENGLENRILKYSYKCNSLSSLVNCVSTKRYTKTRIQRILIHLLLNMNKDEFSLFNKSYPKYIRILGANKKGLKILKEIKKKSDVKIISKFSNYKKISDPLLEKMILLEKKATDIYYMGIRKPPESYRGNMDYFTPPYIKD